MDSILEDTLKKSTEAFEKIPEGMNELPYYYYSTLVNSTPLNKE